MKLKMDYIICITLLCALACATVGLAFTWGHSIGKAHELKRITEEYERSGFTTLDIKALGA